MNQIDIISGTACSTRPSLIVGALLTVFAATPVPAEDTENRFEKQLAPVVHSPAGEWWKSSWHEGWTYQHRGDFSLSARARIRNKNDVSWWQALLTSKATEYLGEINLEVRGNSLADSGVLQNNNGEILLTRYYPRTDVTRAVFRTPVGDPTIVDEALSFIADDEARHLAIKTIMRYVSGAVGGLAGAPAGNPGAGALVAGVVGDLIGEQAGDWVSAEFKKHGIQKRPDGGIEIDPQSSLLQSTGPTKVLADAANLAMQLSEAFSRRIFVIRASGKSGEELDTREIYKEGNDLVSFVEKKESEGTGKAVEWLNTRIPAYRKPEDLVRGVFQRETFALSSKIFDARERKPGDTWVVSADFFNSFLHPDLQGRFRGNVVLRYVRDAKVPDRYDEAVVFDAREIEILDKGTIDGATHHSTLEYIEPNFSAKLREDTEGVLFIDKTRGYLRQANLILDSDGRSNLPEMKILRGLEAVGSSRFEVIYTCIGGPTEP